MTYAKFPELTQRRTTDVFPNDLSVPCQQGTFGLAEVGAARNRSATGPAHALRSLYSIIEAQY